MTDIHLKTTPFADTAKLACGEPFDRRPWTYAVDPRYVTCKKCKETEVYKRATAMFGHPLFPPSST